MNSTRRRLLSRVLASSAVLTGMVAVPAVAAVDPGVIQLAGSSYRMTIDEDGFRYGFVDAAGETVAPPHAVSGLRVQRPGEAQPADAVTTRVLSPPNAATTVLAVGLSDGTTATVHVRLSGASVQLDVDPRGTATVIDLRTGPVAPAYGLGDYGAQADPAPTGTPCGGKVDARPTTELTGIVRDDMTNLGSCMRFLSNFVIFPKQGLGEVLLAAGQKRVGLTTSENRLGVAGVDKLQRMFYFLGDPHTIYAAYKTAREHAGYSDAQPRPEMFDVGWESYGALTWNTYQASVTDYINRYLQQGYPIRWGVVGSGFWPGPRGNPIEGSTSSFGMWDDACNYDVADGSYPDLPCPRYPDPAALKKLFADNGIALLLGGRTNLKALPADGGHYNAEYDGSSTVDALENGYFVTNPDGSPLVLSSTVYPSGASYLLDPQNADAVRWFVQQSAKWGVQGFKEDSALYEPEVHRDDFANNYDAALHAAGNLVIVRNSAFSVPGDVVRINDTYYGHGEDFHHDPDRIPVNLLNLAASGAGNADPDIVGGTPITSATDPSYGRYYVRNAMFDALTPVLAFGRGPWELGYWPYEQAARTAADWHHAYSPYIYDAALDSYHTGYPATMTPLPIAFPDDTATYGLANDQTRQYEWMLGESLLAAPLFGNDFDTAQTRDVYLPAGTWIDYDTGAVFHGPITLYDYPIGVNKVPAFVGGKGVLVARSGNGLMAQVFPIARDGSRYDFTDANGATSHIINDNTGWDFAQLTVTDSTAGRQVAFSVDPQTNAIRFPLQPGHDYHLTGGGDRDLPVDPPAAAPATPSGLASHTQDGVTVLDWSGVPDARGYIAERAGAAGCGPTVVGSTSGTSLPLGPITDAGGTYTVTAYNEAGRSTASAPLTITAPVGAQPDVTVANEQTQPRCDGSVPYAETGHWAASSLKGFDGSGTRYTTTQGSTATWTPDLPTAGPYEVDVWYPANSGNTASARYTVAGVDVPVDQRTNGGQWVPLGDWDFPAGTTSSVTVTVVSSGYTRTDAVRFHRLNS